MANSPAIDFGGSPSGNTDLVDLEGQARMQGLHVNTGTYEYGGRAFADGFGPPGVE